MNILYGVQGTGNGHITRALAMVPLLRSSGHNVKVIFSGKKDKDLFGIEQLKPYEVYNGLTFAVSNGKINYYKSLTNLRPFKFFNDVLKFNLKNIDLIISDFEPITAWAAKFNGIKSIGIGHQYAFFYDIPMKGENLFTKFIIRNFAPTELKIGLHWHHFNQKIFPPIFPEFNLTGNQSSKNKVLVYLPFEDLEKIIEFLSPVKSHDFHIYHDVDTQIIKHNLFIKPFSRNGFKKDLLSAERVICNSGFELPSESLFLGKNILVKPLIGQMEQESNAVAMEQLGWGSVMNELNSNILKNWIQKPMAKPINYPNTAKEIVNIINNMKLDQIDKLSKDVWKNVKLGES